MTELTSTGDLGSSHAILPGTRLILGSTSLCDIPAEQPAAWQGLLEKLKAANQPGSRPSQRMNPSQQAGGTYILPEAFALLQIRFT